MEFECKIDRGFSWLALALALGLLFGLSLPPQPGTGGAKDPAPWARVSALLGWVYFFCWSVSFWPQIFMNWRKKSTVGLSLDFQILNFVGFLCYASYNVSLYFSEEIQREYAKRFGGSGDAVRLNDVLFSAHAAVATAITLFQMFWYSKNDRAAVVQEKSDFSASLENNILDDESLDQKLLGSSDLSANRTRPEIIRVCIRRFVVGLLVLFSVGTVAVLCLVFFTNHRVNWMDLLLYFSYTKLTITVIKYIPQVYENWSRKSTSGWNIYNVLLDLGGGTFSIAQLLIDTLSTSNWSLVSGDPVKLCLGNVSIVFDLVFIVQHYCLYRQMPGIRVGLGDVE